MDEVKQLSVVAPGERLEQGAVCFDLRRPERGEIRAVGGITAGEREWLVPKKTTDYRLWNLITGVGNPDRLGELTELTEEIPQDAPTPQSR